ncbi:hypothetical protein [Verrucomicrobium sp. BvORR106]|uniref:hypothetical protein n=1 Tax=Verrucomicrobium sp. BvORR106 TaxID=1403819 RepID=UPI00056FA2B1|nr:hypothetical protein [Verrucomicrobium sp. BvORR106]
MSHVSPSRVFAEVARAVPEACRNNIVVIGSLAAGYHYFRKDPTKAVRTKDVDCVLEPFHAAVGAGQSIARQLLDAGWQRRVTGDHQKPGSVKTPVEELPAVRLYPPDVEPDSEEAWFIELLTVPESADVSGRVWTRLPLAEGHFGLPTFRFLSVTTFRPLKAGPLGIRYARPEMMVLANLLEHPKIKPERMSAAIVGREIKRSNKDLGRVLAIARLADLDDYRPWAEAWRKALQACFPTEWSVLAKSVGNGMRELMASKTDFEEAHHTCLNGLLSSDPPTVDGLRAAGERVLGDAIEYLESNADR